eukprot:11730847-Ditylum_brightwellii.AAC.1
MLEVTISGKSVKENMLMPSYIVNMHPSIYKASKGIWTIETTQKNLQKAIKDVELAIQALPSAVPDEYFEKFDAFPMLPVIPSYGNSYNFMTQITMNVSIPSNDDKEYVLPPETHGVGVLQLKFAMRQRQIINTGKKAMGKRWSPTTNTLS